MPDIFKQSPYTSSPASALHWLVAHAAATLVIGCTGGTPMGSDDSPGASESSDGAGGDEATGSDADTNDGPDSGPASSPGSSAGTGDDPDQDTGSATSGGPDDPDPVVCEDGHYADADDECEPWAMTLVTTNPRQAALAVNETGQRAVGYMHAPTVWSRTGLSTWDGDDWISEGVLDGSNVTFTHGIALEDDGQLHFAVYDDYAHEVYYGQETVESEVFGYDLKYFPIAAAVGPVVAFRDGIGGHAISVARRSGPDAWTSDALGVEGYPVEIRIAAQDDGGLCMAWSAEMDDSLYGPTRVYRRCLAPDGTPTGPETVLVETAVDEPIRGIDLARRGSTLSLAVATAGGLSYLEGSGDSWTETAIDDLDCRESGAAVAVDSAGQPHLAYVCDWEDRLDPHADFIYGERTSDGTWVHRVVTRDLAVPAPETDPSIKIPTVVDVALDGDDIPYLLYEHDPADDEDTQLRHVTYQGA